MCNQLFKGQEESQKELLAWCETQGIGTMTYGSLGAGILTGAIRELPDWEENDKSYVSTAICGVRDPQQAYENCATYDWELTGEEMKLIDSEIERLPMN